MIVTIAWTCFFLLWMFFAWCVGTLNGFRYAVRFIEERFKHHDANNTLLRWSINAALNDAKKKGGMR